MLIDKWDYRILDVIDAGIEFMLETDLLLAEDINEYRSKLTEDLWLVFNNSNTARIITIYNTDDILTGFAIVMKDTLFTLKPMGIVNKFYVRRPYRGTPYSRQLAEWVTNWFDLNGITESFVTSTAGIGRGKQFENLFKKYGYSVMGSAMRRTHV
jgi:GNAT superfamily N-acetyltransferase